MCEKSQAEITIDTVVRGNPGRVKVSGAAEDVLSDGSMKLLAWTLDNLPDNGNLNHLPDNGYCETIVWRSAKNDKPEITERPLLIKRYDGTVIVDTTWFTTNRLLDGYYAWAEMPKGPKIEV